MEDFNFIFWIKAFAFGAAITIVGCAVAIPVFFVCAWMINTAVGH